MNLCKGAIWPHRYNDTSKGVSFQEISKKLKLPKWKSVRACGIDLYTEDACKQKKGISSDQIVR